MLVSMTLTLMQGHSGSIGKGNISALNYFDNLALNVLQLWAICLRDHDILNVLYNNESLLYRAILQWNLLDSYGLASLF